MIIKVPPIDIPAENPFQNDVLERKQAVEAVANLLEEVAGPFVLAIDSPWGTGKTTYINMLRAFLGDEKCSHIYFNAWETDFSADPMIAFLAGISELANSETKSKFNTSFQKVKNIASVLARKAIPVAGKLATGGLLDLDPVVDATISEFVKGSISDIVESFEAEKNLIVEFHKSLSKAVESLNPKNKNQKVIIFIDELDRCRPTYAIALLERIKHLFNIDNIVFVLSLDKDQLNISLEAIYGNGMDSNEYLRRFIDLEYILPIPDHKSYAENLVKRFGYDDFFSSRTQSEFAYDQTILTEMFVGLSTIFKLSLRALEQCFTRIRVAMIKIPEGHYFFPHILVMLTVIRVSSPKTYHNYAFGNSRSSDVVAYVRSLPGGVEFLNEHVGIMAEAYLIVAKMGDEQRAPEVDYYQKLVKDESVAAEDKARASKLLRIIKDIFDRERKPPLSYVVDKLEMAAQFSR